jgi:O-antigen ligase
MFILKNRVKYIMIHTFFTFGIIAVLQLSFNLNEIIIPALGRDMTLTGRTELWSDVLDMDTNPLIGTGYESFWLGDRLEKIWETNWWQPNQAHNGYLETYLNLGWIGLLLLIGVIIFTYRRICKSLIFDFDYGRLRLALLVIILVYNITEAGFKGLHMMWFSFLLITIEVSDRSQSQIQIRSVNDSFAMYDT